MDDHPVMTFGVRAIFEESNYSEVIECNDFRLVSQKIERHAPDLILFDLHMPMMSLERDFQNLHRKHPSEIFVAYTADYDTTLMAWYERFLASWPEIADNYSERFKRMFSYYLNACAGAFRARDIQLWQVVFSRGIEHGLRIAR